VHAGPFVDFDRTYAALGSHVAANETAAPGPIREIYLVSPSDTTDEAGYRTEVCWPIAS
jgi:effector-binding domain-containing protein